MGDLVEVIIFFPNLWSRESPCSGVRNFFSTTFNGVMFFSVQDIVFPGISLHAFFLSKSVCRIYFFLKSPITPSKVKWSAPRIHQTFAQLTDSKLSIISKAF